MEYQLRAVEYGVLEIIRKLDGIEVAGIGTKLAEHAVTQVVQIIVKHLLLLSCLRVLSHVAQDLNGSIGAGLFAQCASGTLVAAILVTLEYQATAVALSYVECSLAVLGLLKLRL